MINNNYYDEGGSSVSWGGGGDPDLSVRCYRGLDWITVFRKEECYRLGGSLKRGGYGYAHGYGYGVKSHKRGGHGAAHVGGGMGYGYSYSGGYAVGGGGYSTGGGYGYEGQQRIIRYVPTSPAAAMQMERRARKGQAGGYGTGGGYGYGGGYAVGGYGGGYSYGGGYGGDYGAGYGDSIVVQPRKHKRKKHVRYGGPMYPSYDPGVVIHYGPVVTKGGAY